MPFPIACAPCCWGVDDVKNPHLPPWQRVLDEAAQAGYKGIELGPYGYMPLAVDTVGPALRDRGLSLVAGTIFDDLVNESNLPSLLRQTREICGLIRQLPALPTLPGQRRPGPYLVVMDWGHTERDFAAGHSDRAPRLSASDWQRMMSHIRQIATVAQQEFDIRAVVHPHAGGYIEFDDEILQVVQDLSDDIVGLCLDTGHLRYSGMDPAHWLRAMAHRLDYVHFKDIDLTVFDQVMGERIAFFDACARGVMCPIGKGSLDYPGLKRVLEDIDYHGPITIEQERDPRHADTSLADVQASLRYLQSVGFA